MPLKSEAILQTSVVVVLGLTLGALVLCVGQFLAPQPFEGVQPTPILPVSPFQLPIEQS